MVADRVRISQDSNKKQGESIKRTGENRTLAYVALGSNLGERLEYLRNAVRLLGLHPSVEVTRLSPIYETEPHVLKPGETQPPYLNAVVELWTSLSPDELLGLLQEVEQSAGREKSRVKWSPRTLDLDLLMVGQEIRETEQFQLPHLRMGERLFVLQPLVDIAPDLYVPSPSNATASELLSRCPDAGEITRTDYILQVDQEL